MWLHPPASLRHNDYRGGTVINDDNRSEYHLIDESNGTDCHYDDAIYVNDPCTDDHCPITHYVVISLDDYRELVAAARDRHPTNHQPSGIDPAAYIASLPPYPSDP